MQSEGLFACTVKSPDLPFCTRLNQHTYIYNTYFLKLAVINLYTSCLEKKERDL